MTKSKILTLCLVTAGSLTSTLAAQQVPDRVTLNQILGTHRTTEGFEGSTWTSSGPSLLGSVLNRSTIVTFLSPVGPGLVAPGASYSSQPVLAWASPTGGLTSKAIGFSPFSSELFIDYGVPVPACGLDVIIYGNGFANLPVTVEFFGPNSTLLGSVQNTIAAAGQYEFAGWQDAGGIASVRIRGGTGFQHLPYIDNHTFGLSQADASQQSTFGEGCNDWRASFYQIANPFNLSGRSVKMDYANGVYSVSTSTVPVATPTGAPMNMANNSVQPMPLGWTLPFPGGSTNTLYVSSNGFVRFAPNPSATWGVNQLLNDGPTVAALGRTFDHTLGGSVIFETDPVAQTATLTYDQVPNTTTALPNTFQLYFDATGAVEMRFGTCATNLAITGWSPGQQNLDPGSTNLLTAAPFTLAPDDRVPLGMYTVDYPFIGSSVQIELIRIPAGSVAALYAFSTTQTAPIDLTTLGMPGCHAYALPDITVAKFNPMTMESYVLAIPPQPALIGQTLWAQGFALDPVGAHNPFGGITSNGLKLDIGLF